MNCEPSEMTILQDLVPEKEIDCPPVSEEHLYSCHIFTARYFSCYETQVIRK